MRAAARLVDATGVALPRFLVGAGVIFALVLLPAAPARAQSVCPDAELRVSAATSERAAAAIHCLVNVERAARDLPGVAPESRLRLAALGHALDMVVRHFFGHDAPSPAPNGGRPHERISRAGYDWWAWGENVAAGHPTPRRVMEGWMASEGHCRNVLESDFTELGVGVVAPPSGRVHWAQNFGLPKGQRPPESSDATSTCPVRGLADGVAPAAPPSASDAGRPASREVRVRYRLRKVGRGRLKVSGRVRPSGAAERVRISLRRKKGPRRVLVRKVRSDGTFSVRVKAPRGRGGVRASVRPRSES